jgi:hypothetical protein
MADPVYGLTQTAAKQVGQVVREVLRTLPPTGRRTRRVIGGGAGSAAQGRLTSALTACDNALTGATTFTFARYVTDSDIDPQTDPVTMKEEVDSEDPPAIVETEGVNRSPLEAAVDGHVVCVKINGEWVPVLVFDVCPE